MNFSPYPSTGFVPSLEVMPMVDQAMHGQAWQMRAFSGYGRIIRALLTGDITAGLIPWELFVTELLSKPGQRDRWAVPLVIHACPMELFLTPGAMKHLRPPPAKKGEPSSTRLLFGIEARRSYTRFQILEWQKSLAIPHLEAPTFKVLPMELMLKGLKAGVIDGVVAPTPWGMQAEANGTAVINQEFTMGDYEQKVVLACQRSAAEDNRELLHGLPLRLKAAHKRLDQEDAFIKTAEFMAGLGSPRFDPAMLLKAARLYLKGAEQEDLHPDAAWLHAELAELQSRGMLGDATTDLEKLAQRLELPFAFKKAGAKAGAPVAPPPPSTAG